MKKLHLVLGLAAVLATGSSAFATVVLDYVGLGSPVGTVHIVGTDAASGINGNYYAGWEKIRLDGGPVFQTMCIDIGDSAADTTVATIVSLDQAPDAWAGPMGVTAASNIKLLWGSYAAGATTAKEAAALQIAIWKTIDSAMSTYSLTFSDYGTSGAVVRADAMLAALGSTSASLMAVTSKMQDFLVPVPEPTTMIAGALLLLPFGVSTLRILRKNRAA